jgi:hypothetical protein
MEPGEAADFLLGLRSMGLIEIQFLRAERDHVDCVITELVPDTQPLQSDVPQMPCGPSVGGQN